MNCGIGPFLQMNEIDLVTLHCRQEQQMLTAPPSRDAVETFVDRCSVAALVRWPPVESSQGRVPEFSGSPARDSRLAPRARAGSPQSARTVRSSAAGGLRASVLRDGGRGLASSTPCRSALRALSLPRDAARGLEPRHTRPRPSKSSSPALGFLGAHVATRQCPFLCAPARGRGSLGGESRLRANLPVCSRLLLHVLSIFTDTIKNEARQRAVEEDAR